jgi:hypothetical protein
MPRRAVASKSRFQNGMDVAWQGNGMGAAWERHGMCELAFGVIFKGIYRKPLITIR